MTQSFLAERVIVRTAAVLLLAVTGCTSPDPAEQPADPKPSTEPADTPDEPSPASAAVLETDTGSTDPSTPDESARPDTKRLKALLAKLTFDSGGNWEVDDERAAELDELDLAAAVVVPLMSDSSVDVRRGATYYLLDRFDESDAAMVRAFVGAIRDDDRLISSMSLQVITRLEPAVLRTAFPALAQLLTETSRRASTRAAAARLIGSLGEDTQDAAGKLAKSARSDPDASVRSACVMAFSKVATLEDKVKVFADVLGSDKDAKVRRVAAARLRQMGPDAAPAARQMSEALEDQDAGVRRSAFQALLQMGPSVIPVVIPRLASADSEVQLAAVTILAFHGKAASSAVPELKKLADDDDERVRQQAAALIQRLTRPPDGN